MLNSFQILPEQRQVRVVYPFHPEFAEWKEMMDAIFADPRFAPGFHFLCDKRAVEAASTAFVERTSEFYTQHASQLGRCAILVGNLLAFGMSRMTEAYSVNCNVRAFTDPAAAEAWLLRDDAAERVAA